MAELKTKRTGASVKKFLDGIENERKREDAKTVAKMMEKITGAKPEMWGPSIVGFGSYRYEYESGREGEFFLTGFSPRKQALTLYIMSGFSEYDGLLAKLGKHKTGKACLYLNKLDDVDLGVLEKLVRASVRHKSRRAG